MHAAEVNGPLEDALAHDRDFALDMPSPAEPSVSISVASTLGTFQALNVLRRTGGAARSAGNEQVLQTQRDLAALEGVYVETSSALSVAVLPKLVEDGAIDPDSTVVAVLTSDGLKDPQTTADHMPPIPESGPDLDSVVEILRDVYGHDMTVDHP